MFVPAVIRTLPLILDDGDMSRFDRCSAGYNRGATSYFAFSPFALNSPSSCRSDLPDEVALRPGKTR